MANIVLITGVSGFVGANLGYYLLNKGYKVIGTYFRNKPKINHPNFIPVQVYDPYSKHSWDSLIKESNFIIHLIGKAHVFNKNDEKLKVEFIKVNVNITKAILESLLESKEKKKFVYISSISAISSNSNVLINNDSDCNPDTLYGLSKYYAEKIIEELLDHKVHWCILRPVSIYGPGDPGNLSKLIEVIKKLPIIPVLETENKRSFLYIGNFIETLYKVLLSDQVWFKKYVVADNEVISTSDLIKAIGTLMNKKLATIPIKAKYLKLIGYFGDFISKNLKINLPINSYFINRFIGNLYVTNYALKKDLNFEMPFSLFEGIKLTIKNAGGKNT